MKTQIALKQINLSKGAAINGAFKLKKECKSSWLSFEASIKSVYQVYEAVLQTLHFFES